VYIQHSIWTLLVLASANWKFLPRRKCFSARTTSIPNVYIVFDDIVIAVADDAEHDTALRELLERARKYNMRFNPSENTAQGTDCSLPWTYLVS